MDPILYCPKCGDNRKADLIERKETYPVRGESTTIDAQVAVCSVCRSDILDLERDQENMIRAFELYRLNHNLLTADDIRNLRNRYGLSQRSLARLLGWGNITIQRYESGSLQDLAHDMALRSLLDPKKVLELMSKPTCRLSAKEQRELSEIIKLNRRDVLLSNIRQNVADLIDLDDGIAHGFRTFDFDRLGNVVLWFANRLRKDLFKTKLAKLLWLSDFFHFYRERISLTGLAYVRAPFGPIPDNYSLLLNVLAVDEVIALNELNDDSGKAVVEPLRACDGEYFVPSELKTLQIIFDHFGVKRAGQLSRASHKESAWIGRSDGDIIPYTEADELEMITQLDR